MIADLSRIVREVGYKLLAWREADGSEGIWEGSQFKAKADLLAHEMLSGSLRHLWPEIPVVSEEDSSSLLEIRPDRYWLIDPIDGTASFSHGYPGFVTQASLIVRNVPCIAAVYAPILDSLYVAERGRGAFINGRKLDCTCNKGIKTLIDNYPEPRGVTLEAYEALNFSNYMECGSISLKICKVAEQSADLFFKGRDVIIRDWDVAAPQVIIEEAGGFLTDINGNEIAYRGSYERTGVVAAASKETAMRLVSWYETWSRGTGTT